jgi:hypothetical protein
MEPDINPVKTKPIRLYLPLGYGEERTAAINAAHKAIEMSGGALTTIDDILRLTDSEELQPVIKTMQSAIRLGEMHKNSEGRLNVVPMLDVIRQRTDHEMAEGKSAYTVMVIPQGLYAKVQEGKNQWERDAFGLTLRGYGTIVSVHDMQKAPKNERESLLYHLLCHELGHVFNTPSTSRNHDIISNMSGTHCTNQCIMQQGSSSGQNRLEDLSRLVERAPQSVYCPACQNDIYGYFRE